MTRTAEAQCATGVRTLKNPWLQKHFWPFLAKFCKHSTKFRTLRNWHWAGLRDSIAAGFPLGKRPEFPTGTCPLGLARIQNTKIYKQNPPLPSPVDSIREAVLTVSPNRQYLGILMPTTPAHTGPATYTFLLQHTATIYTSAWGNRRHPGMTRTAGLQHTLFFYNTRQRSIPRREVTGVTQAWHVHRACNIHLSSITHDNDPYLGVVTRTAGLQQTSVHLSSIAHGQHYPYLGVDSHIPTRVVLNV